MKEYDETDINNDFCPFCGEWLIKEERCEDHEFYTEFRCECKDFLLNRELEDKIAKLERQLPRKKFGIITKHFIGEVK